MTTDLRELLGDAAHSDVRADLAERAIGGARARRRQSFVVGGSVLAAAAVVLGVVVASDDLRTDAEPRPTDVASLPVQLPAADGLPPLVDGTMDAASAAYVVDGEVVVIDAATGDGAVVDFESMPLNFVGPMTGVTDRSVASLSPDGSALVVSTGRGEREVLLLVDVATGRIVPENRFLLSQDNQGGQWSRVAWSPDSEQFACICTWEGFPASAPVSLLIVDVTRVEDDLQFLGPWTKRLFPRQISWGTDGLVAEFEGSGDSPMWRVVPLDRPEAPNKLPDPLLFDEPPNWFGSGPASQVVMSHAATGGQLVWATFTAKACTSESCTTYSVRRGGLLAGASVADGYLYVQAPTRPGADELTVDLFRQVDLDDPAPAGGMYSVSALPAGTTAASFASALVEVATVPEG